FDVAAGGRSVINLQTGQVNESCTPNDFTLFGGNLHGGVSSIGSDGSFALQGSGNSTVGGDPSTYSISIIRHISGATAPGTIAVSDSFTHDGTQYTCSSGNQTWSATLG